jgi:peptide deformylase
MVKTYNPYNRYASSLDVSLGKFLIEDWKCELVEPNHPTLYKSSTVDPFSGNVDWVEREKQMIQLMHDNMGVGLSSNQIGSNYNMFVMSHSFLGDIGVYKPKILQTENEVVIEEGCLTWPLLYLRISRAEKIQVQYTKNDGVSKVETWMDGIDARCFLHEYDHLQGVNFIDLVSDFKLQRAKQSRDKRFKKLSRQIR